MTDFKNKLIEYEDDPPEDIISYAARLSVNEMSCVHREAENVMIENDKVNYALFCLQNLLKNIVDEYTEVDKTSNNHNKNNSKEDTQCPKKSTQRITAPSDSATTAHGKPGA